MLGVTNVFVGVTPVVVVTPVALGQYLLLHAGEAGRRLPAAVPPTREAQDALEGPPHVLVPEGVDDGVDEGVALGQHQAVLLVAEHLAAVAAQAVQQQHHQAGCPADHEAACKGVGGVKGGHWAGLSGVHQQSLGGRLETSRKSDLD